MHREICCTGISHMCCASALLDVIRDMSLYADVYQTDGSITPGVLLRSMARLDQAKADANRYSSPTHIQLIHHPSRSDKSCQRMTSGGMLSPDHLTHLAAIEALLHRSLRRHSRFPTCFCKAECGRDACPQNM